MRFISARKQYSTYAKTGLLGLALISLASCSSGDSTTPVVTSSGSAALQGPIAFVNNRDDKTLGTEEGCAACHRWRRTRGCP